MIARCVAFLMLLALAACGGTSGPVEIPPDELPFPVARDATPSETAAPARTFVIYFIRDARLEDVRRRIRADVPAAEAALRALLEGPTRAERRRRLSTELPPGVRVLTVTVEEGTALVDLSAEFQEPATPEAIAFRVAQVVWTMTGVEGVVRVRFAIQGESIAVTTGDGTVVRRPVVRTDYLGVRPVDFVADP